MQSVAFSDFSMPVYSKVDATARTTSGDTRSLLARQLTSPVRWEDSVKQMLVDGIEGFIEVGTGRVLRGTIKRINRKTFTIGFGDAGLDAA